MNDIQSILEDSSKYMNNLETYLKHTRDKNEALTKLLTSMKDIQNNAANKLKFALIEFQNTIY